MLVLASYGLTALAATAVLASGRAYRGESVSAVETSFDARDHAGEEAIHG
jgi:hypothetical protein